MVEVEMETSESKSSIVTSECETSIGEFLKKLSQSATSTKKQQHLLNKLRDSSELLEKYLNRSANLKELFDLLDETVEQVNELKHSAISLSINDTNAQVLLELFEKILLNLLKQWKHSQDEQQRRIQAEKESNGHAVVLVTDRLDLKKSLNHICATLLNKYLSGLIAKCLMIKSNPSLQETCVRLLTICVQQSIDFAKQIALEFNHFNERKNWLERCLLMRKTELREACVRFLMSFLKYSSSEFAEHMDNVFLIKKIFLNMDMSSKGVKNEAHADKAENQMSSSSLIYCLFMPIQADSHDSIAFMLEELLFKCVQNELFNKSEKIRIFNEKTLANLVKLFDWSTESDDASETLLVREMIGEFLKCLFCSTRHGISFYDRTLGVENGAKNLNHLIFNTLIGIQRAKHNAKSKQAASAELIAKTNQLIDDLMLKTLKVCPDLTQRFLKVKHKQELANSNLDWFVHFCSRLFAQQQQLIRSMRKNYLNSHSFLRSIALGDLHMLPRVDAVESDATNSKTDSLRLFMNELIVHTSLPLCLSYQKLLTSANAHSEQQEQTLELMINSLKCLKEWKECLRAFECDFKEQQDSDDAQILPSSNQQQDSTLNKQTRQLIYDNLSKLFDLSGSSKESFFAQLNIQLLTKYLPNFDVFLSSSSQHQLEQQLALKMFDIFSLYFDIFLNLTPVQLNNALTEATSECVNRHEEWNEMDNGSFLAMLQIDALDKSLNAFISSILSASESTRVQDSLTICQNYLKFMAKYLSLKETGVLMSLSESIDDQRSEVPHEHLLSEQRDVNIDNLVKMLFKFASTFKELCVYFIQLVRVCLNDANFGGRFDHECLYLWFSLCLKHLKQVEQNEPKSVEFFRQFVYLCLFNLMNSKQRNSILFQMSLNEAQRESASTQQISLNELMAFICLHAQIQMDPSGSHSQVSSFLSEFVIYSSLMQFNECERRVPRVESLVDKHFTNHLFDQSQQFLSNTYRPLYEHKFKSIRHLMSKKSERVSAGGIPFRIGLLSQAFLFDFQQCVNEISSGSEQSGNENDDGLLVTYVNMSMRVRHLLVLLGLCLNSQADELGFKSDDVEEILSDLRNCFRTCGELGKLDSSKDKVKWQEDFEFYSHFHSYLLRLILNNCILRGHVFHNEQITRFLMDLWSESKEQQATASEKGQMSKHFEQYLSILLGKLEQREFELHADHFELITGLNLTKSSFETIVHLLNKEERNDEQSQEAQSKRFEFFARMLLKNQNFLFEREIEFLDELNLLTDSHFHSFELLIQSTQLLLNYLTNLDFESSDLEPNRETLRAELTDFLLRANKYKPVLFKLVCRIAFKQKSKVPKRLKRFCSTRSDLLNVFESTLTNEKPEEQSKNDEFTESAELNVANSTLNELLDAYTYKLSQRDQAILRKIYKSDASLNCLLFKLATQQQQHSSDTLNKQVKMVDFVNAKLDTKTLQASIRNFPFERKVDDLSKDECPSWNLHNDYSNVYDPLYLLPNLFNLLNFANIVDVVQFVQRGVLSFLFAALSSECEHLRSLAYGSIYRFKSHLENSRCYFKNTIIYLIDLLRNSLEKENQRLPTVISVFLAETVLVVIEPGTSLYKPIMSFLLIKPAMDLANVPEFYKLFNSSSLQFKNERKWILTVLASSCRTSLDYRLFEKRFVYRQVLSIYDSKLSDSELNSLVLDLILKTCKCKYALIDLIKRHYLLVWLTSAFDKLHIKNQNLNSNQLKKLLRIFVLVWQQLGQNESSPQEELLPITFLNQMFVCSRIIINKLSTNFKTISTNDQDDTKENQKSFQIGEILTDVFKCNRQIANSIKKYKFNLIQLQTEESLSQKLNDLVLMKWDDVSLAYDLIISELKSSKRKIEQINGSEAKESGLCSNKRFKI